MINDESNTNYKYQFICARNLQILTDLLFIYFKVYKKEKKRERSCHVSDRVRKTLLCKNCKENRHLICRFMHTLLKTDEEQESGNQILKLTQ